MRRLLAYRAHLAVGYASCTVVFLMSPQKSEAKGLIAPIQTASRQKSSIAISYVTDIEGNFDYWERFKRMSRVLTKGPNGELQLQDNCHLVFGGDVCDRGPGDIRVTTDLVKLKDRYPDRVHLILGNRDTNKLRLLVETDPKVVSTGARPFWGNHLVDVPTSSAIERLKWVSAFS